MRELDLLIVLCLACTVPLLSHRPVCAADIPADPAEITQEVTMRCMYDMGEFGQAGMDACVKADLAAVEALKRYPPEAQPIIDRCFLARWTLGYSMVQQCVNAELDKK